MRSDRPAGGQPTTAIPLHPILFALAPILFVYVYNSAQVPISPKELVLPILISVAAAAVLWLILGLLLRNAAKAAMIVSLCLVLFFLYGHVGSALGPRRVNRDFLTAVWALLLAVGVWVTIRVRRIPAGATVFLNLAAAGMLIVNLATGIPALLRNRTSAKAATAFGQSAADYPDIYYIILDTYARADVLRQAYHTDVTDFQDFLRQTGFRVLERSRSNYAQTYLSLASSLNFTYLDSIAAAEGPKSVRKAPVIQMINNSRLVDFLRRRGYTIVSFATGYTGTDLADADLHFAPRVSLSEFQNVLISTTFLPVVLNPLLRKSQDDLHRDRVLYTLRDIPKSAQDRHPVFVFAHIVSPHTPFVFDARGERPKIPPYLGIDQTGTMQTINRELIREWFRDNYGPQVTYLNVLLKTLVGQILRESRRPPVIILQGDHGPGALLTWDEPERSQLEERHAIFNAVYDPLGTEAFYDSLTPVNSFRILLSQVFDTTMPLLPDKSYFSTLALPFRLFDIDHPETYPERIRETKGAQTVNGVAFPEARRMPANIATYSRQLLNLRYRGTPTRVGQFTVRPVVERLTVEQAYELYRRLVAGGELPDFGTQYDSYAGRGPDQDTLVALFFPVRQERE